MTRGWIGVILVGGTLVGCGGFSAAQPAPGSGVRPRDDTVVRADSARGAEPVGRDSTRLVWVEGDPGPLVSDIVEAVAPGLGIDMGRVSRVAEALSFHDRAYFPLFPVLAGPDGRLEVEVELRAGLGPGVWLRVHGSGDPFRAAADVVDRFWRESLGPLDGSVVLTLREVRRGSGLPATPRLEYTAPFDSGCGGIVAELTRISGPILVLDLLGLSDPSIDWFPCGGPPGGGVELDLAPGVYPLRVRHFGIEDRYRAVLTDSTLALEIERSTVTGADTRVRLRYPSRSFELSCRGRDHRRALCGRLRDWVASRPGITVRRFPPGPIPPPGWGGDGVYYRYADPGVLEIVRACVDALHSRLEGLGEVTVSLAMWTGEWIRPRPSAPAATPDAGDTPGVPCFSWIPPPSADTLGPGPWDPGSRPRYGYGGQVSCEEFLEIRAGLGPDENDPAVAPRRVPGSDGAVGVAAPIMLPDGWRVALVEGIRTDPVRIAANTSRSATSRSGLHHDLRQWRCRGGDIVGDAARYPGTAWIWAEDAGNWYFLRSGATAAGVADYLALVDEHGEALAWRAREDRESGPRLVGFGPNRRTIPGFPLYLWRP